jgi:hypothetical protein
VLRARPKSWIELSRLLTMDKHSVYSHVYARLLAGLLGISSVPALAHHSTSLFDASKQITLSGTVSSVYWGNPHIYIKLLVPSPDGKPVATWSIISGTPALNVRNGWKYGDVKAGDKVTAMVNPARDGSQEAILDQITLADGRTIEGPREFLKKPG